jgi:two-component system NarL family sensor kinase
MGVAAILVAAVLMGQLVGHRAVPTRSITLTAAVAVSFTAMAALVLAGVPGHLVGRLMAAVGAIAYLAILAASWSSWLPLSWLSQWLWWPPLGLIVLTLLVFPDGRLPSRRWWLLAGAIIVATVLASVAMAVAALDYPRTLFTTVDRRLTLEAAHLIMIAKVAVLVVGVGLFAVVVSLALRWRRAGGETRQQLGCLLAAGAVLPPALVLDAVGLAGTWVIAAAALPVSMTLAVLRYHLYGLDRIINRTVVWLVMSFLVIVGFVATVKLLRDVLMGGDDSNASLVATGLIVVAFQPVRRGVQRAVDRLLYGDRDDPYKVIASLGDLLGQTVDPHALLPLLTQGVARSMQVPYVAVELAGPDGPRLFTADGIATATVERFDMVARGIPVGQLLVGTRSPGSRFTKRERRLLSDAAVHAAAAAEATRLIRELQDSRERLVRVREEERRQLRRELHDGVGPALAGMSMQVRAASKIVNQPTRLSGKLDMLASDLVRCQQEVRQVVDQLGPPALDAGLEAALRAECRRFDDSTLCVELRTSESLEGLPAAIEVAAYRIVSEALTNVTRHARARSCRVTIARHRSLAIEIADDGVGIGHTTPGRRGVGLQSMRERAAELGGDCVVSEVAPHGTAVRVELPIDVAASQVEDRRLGRQGGA